MSKRTAGRYQVTSTVGEKVTAYIPFPLPPEPPLELTGGRQLRLERATLALGRLDSISTLLPDPHIFLYSNVRREAVLSSQIEGTQSSLSDLLLFEMDGVPGTPLADVLEVSGYVAALEHGMMRLQEGFPLSNRLLREMHSVLMLRGRGSDKQPGEFRRSQNWIGGTRPGNARFVPPPPEEVETCMADLERFIHQNTDELPELIKTAMVHVQFETIHPFLDGNGRLGRLLIALLLHHGNLLQQPLLYLSIYFKEHRSHYYELLDRVRTEGDWESWIDFFLGGVESTANGAVLAARQLIDLFESDKKRIRESGKTAANAVRVLEAFRRNPLLTLTFLRNHKGITFPTAAKAMQLLVDLGIAKELTGQRRNRVFVYEDYLNILNQEAQAL
jgi:Fic family protein